MTIASVKYTAQDEGTLRIVLDDGTVLAAGLTISGDPHSIGNGPTMELVKKWLDAGNTPLLADPPEPPPTADQKLVAWKANSVNAAMLKVMAADSGRTEKQIDDAIKAKM